MTVVIALERSDIDAQSIPISHNAATVGGSSAYFEAGQSYSMRHLLHATMLISGNDAAVAIAEYVGGDEAGFVALMNEKAQELHLYNTHFANPQGFDEPDHFSSADDVATLVSYAMQNSQFREIVATPYYSEFDADGVGTGAISPESLIDPYRPNTNELLLTYPGANGVKTGMTDAAGYCLAASAVRDGIEMYAIILGAPSESERFQEAADLLSFGFDHYKERVLMEADTELGTVEVANYLDVSVRVGLAQTTVATYYDLLGPVEHTVTLEEVRAPVTRDTIVGFVTFTHNGEVIATEPITSFEEIEKPTLFQSIGFWFTRTWRSITGAD